MNDDETKMHEVWREEYVKDAYSDQTGAKHWGHVVHSRMLLRETGRFACEEPYSGKVYPEAGIIAVDGLGREFRYTPNMTDYHGGGRWKCSDDGTFWVRPPRSVAGWCYPDGTAPVTKIID